MNFRARVRRSRSLKTTPPERRPVKKTLGVAREEEVRTAGIRVFDRRCILFNVQAKQFWSRNTRVIVRSNDRMNKRHAAFPFDLTRVDACNVARRFLFFDGAKSIFHVGELDITRVVASAISRANVKPRRPGRSLEETETRLGSSLATVRGT